MNLLEKTVSDLMENFGAGNHKPGSGSAAAFQGMVSAKLISTVIALTAEEKRKPHYDHCLPELIDFHEEIETRIYPRLAELFQLDSEQFDKTIKLRIERDNEKDEILKNQLRRQALEELKVSIAIPFEIASLCKELAEMAAYVFDEGFKAARGDSQVGLSGAVSALAGCMSIIRLNVLSFSSDEYEYSKTVVAEVDNLNKDYEKLNNLASLKIKVLQDEFDAKIPLFEGINNLISKYRNRENLNIEECVRELQNLVWLNKDLIWKNVPADALGTLRPASILKQVLGYDYIDSDVFGVQSEDGAINEVAGVIDQPNKLVAVSNNYPIEVQRFTAAHELGHAILHSQPVMHRDVPTDHIGGRGSKDLLEFEADKFATYYLMPETLVRREFKNIFSTKQFELNEDSAFNFGGRSTTELRMECKDIRGLSRKLATTEKYNNTFFTPLNKIFNVSATAMTIRLIELNLVKY